MNEDKEMKVDNKTTDTPALESSIELPDIAVPESVKHIPTLEEIEAQKKAEENAEIAKKRENHNKTFSRDEEVIYTLKDEKEGNPLIIIGIFAIIFIFLFSLPTVTKKVSKLLGIDITYFENIMKPNTATNQGQTGEEENKKHHFNDSSTRVSIGQLALTNFVKSKTDKDTYEINFTIINEGNESYIYDKKYFIALYNDEKILYRALIHSYDPLASKAANELSLPISETAYRNANAFELVEISTTQYPDINIINQSDNYKLLTCTYNNDTMEYYFEDDMLVKVKEKYYEEQETSTSYFDNFYTYQGKSKNYQTIDGFVSTFVETSNDFTMITEISLDKVQDIVLNNLKEYRYFKFRTDSRVVSFEIQSMGYTCDTE